jgi:hypothetical protein
MLIWHWIINSPKHYNEGLSLCFVLAVNYWTISEESCKWFLIICIWIIVLLICIWIVLLIICIWIILLIICIWIILLAQYCIIYNSIVKRLGCEADSWPPSSVEELMELYLHSPHIFMVWCLVIPFHLYSSIHLQIIKSQLYYVSPTGLNKMWQ